MKEIINHQKVINQNIAKSFTSGSLSIEDICTPEEITKGAEVFTPEMIKLYKNDLTKSFNNKQISAEEFEKAIKDLSRLAMRQIIDKNGHKKTVYVKVAVDEKGNSKSETDFETGHSVKFTKDGKEHVGKIKSLKFHDKTDKVGTAMVEVDGKSHSVSLSKLEHEKTNSDEKTIMQEIGGDDDWSIQKQAIHLAKHLKKDKDYISYLENGNLKSKETMLSRLRGLEEEYLYPNDKKSNKMSDKPIISSADGKTVISEKQANSSKLSEQEQENLKKKREELKMGDEVPFRSIDGSMTSVTILANSGGKITFSNEKGTRMQMSEGDFKERMKSKEEKIENKEENNISGKERYIKELLESNKKSFNSILSKEKEVLKKLKDNGFSTNHHSHEMVKRAFSDFKELGKHLISKMGKKYNLDFDLDFNYKNNEGSIEVGFDKYRLKEDFPDDYNNSSRGLASSQINNFAGYKVADLLNEEFSYGNEKYSGSSYGSGGNYIYKPLVRFYAGESKRDGYYGSAKRKNIKKGIDELSIEKAFNKVGTF